MRIVSLFARLARTGTAIAVTAMVAACSNGMDGEFDDVYVPVSHSERYPIEVVKGTIKVNVPTKSARMTPAQIDAVTRFAQQAHETAAQSINIRRPRNSVNGDVIAGRVTQIFAEQGVSGSRLHHTTYPGRNGAPVSLSFVRKFAKTKKCDGRQTRFTDTGSNEVYGDFACYSRHNLAAMIANPKDLETPRTMTPADPMRRSKVFVDYRTPKSPTTPADENSTVNSTDKGKS